MDMKKKVSEIIFVRKKSYKVENTGTKIYSILKKKKKISRINYKKINIIKLRLNDYFNEGIKLLKKNKFALTK